MVTELERLLFCPNDKRYMIGADAGVEKVDSKLKKRSRKLRSFLRRWRLVSALFGIATDVTLAVFMLLAEMWFSAARQQLSQIEKPDGSAPARLSEQEAFLKEKLEMYSKRSDDLEHLLEILVAVSGVSAIALYLKALEEAKESSDKLQHIQQEARDRVDKLFPIFEDMEIRVRNTMERLTAILPALDIDLTDYKSLKPEEIEQVLYYEKTMAASEYFNLKSLSQIISQIYQGLGTFYVLRSQPSKPAPASAAATQSEPPSSTLAMPSTVLQKEKVLPGEKLREEERQEEDLSRARFYFKRSIDLNSRNTRALNDFGYLELVAAKQWQEAKKLFTTAGY